MTATRRATNAAGQIQTEADWNCQSTLVKRGASIGSGATLIRGNHDRRKCHRRRWKRRNQRCAPRYNCRRQSCEDLEEIRNNKMQTKVPFLDLKSHHAPMLEEINALSGRSSTALPSPADRSSLDSKRISRPYCDSRYAIGVGSGTEALWLRPSGVGCRAREMR